MSRLERLKPIQKDLIDAAIGQLTDDYDETWHSVASAARTENGQTFSGLNLRHFAAKTCAEMSVLNIVTARTMSPINTIVSVRYVHETPQVVNSCGRCVQVLGDIFPEIQFIVDAPDEEELAVARVSDMLPFAYVKPEGAL